MAGSSFEAGKILQKKKLINPRNGVEEVKRMEFNTLTPTPRKAGISSELIEQFERVDNGGNKKLFFAMVYTMRNGMLEKRNLRVGGYGSLRGAIRAIQKNGNLGGVYDEHRALAAAVFKGNNYPYSLKNAGFRVWEQDSQHENLANMVVVHVDYWQFIERGDK